ncbi:MAG: transglycosylase SLT domain-containing protein [Acidobacteriota bacterium]
MLKRVRLMKHGHDRKVSAIAIKTRKTGVRKRRHLRLRQFSRMRERARLYEPFTAAAARKHGVDPRALWTIAYLARFRAELVSPARALGLMQFVPGTAKRFNLTNPMMGRRRLTRPRYVKEIVAQFGGRLDPSDQLTKSRQLKNTKTSLP